MTDITVEEVLTAYRRCRRTKRSAATTIEFETDLSANITDLTRKLAEHRWQPSTSMCFAVTDPKPREIWAAQFKDRVVHHVIHGRLKPRFEPRFIRTSFACIEGRGTLAAADWADRKIRSATAGWTRDAYALQIDIANFFPSINQQRLLDMLTARIDEPWLAAATATAILHRPTSDVHFPGDPDLLERVERRKSLWHTADGYGLPIGNLTSQFGANVYMDRLDQHVVRNLRPRAYGRYVDDLLLVDLSADTLWRVAEDITRFAADVLELAVHPGKTRLVNCREGVDFVGWTVGPHHRRLRRSTARRANRRISERSADPGKLAATVNSYLGLARHGNTERLRASWVAMSGLQSDAGNTKVVSEESA